MTTLGRALLRGASYGFAMTAVEVWLNASRGLSLGIRSPLPMAASGAAMMLAFAVVVGGATLAAARRGPRWHYVAMAIVWCAIQEYAAVAGRDGRLHAVLTPVGGLALAGLGAWIGRRLRWAPAIVGTLVLVAGLLAPEVAARLRTLPPAAVPLPPARPGAPDVVVVVLDAVRADHLGAYGYTRPTSPRFDALAREGTLFLDAVSPATWSLPSHASLFTGRFVSAHGAHDEHPFLEPGPPTLAERFAAAGYDTRAFTADAWLADSLGLTRGFRWTDEAWRRGNVGRAFPSMYRLLDRLGFGGEDKGGAVVAGNVEAWLAARPAGDRPTFTFVDVMEAELGSTLPTGADAIEQATAAYDAGVANADALLGRVVDALRRRGRLDRTVVVVLADHGELLGEHGDFGHGRSLYEPVLHVPLLVRFPPVMPAGRRVDAPVSVTGVYATVLDLAGLPPEPSAQVGSLRAVVEGAPHPGPILAEQFAAQRGSRPIADDPLLETSARLRAYRMGRRKLVDAEPGGTFLFDLDEDPGEEHEVSMKRRLDVVPLREELDTWRERVGIPDLRAPVGKPPPKAIDPAAKERLRQLGYVE